jgi:hypothetical protein
VQVKTRSGKDYTFDSGFLALHHADANSWAVLTAYQPSAPWTFTVLPRNHAAAAVI